MALALWVGASAAHAQSATRHAAEPAGAIHPPGEAANEATNGRPPCEPPPPEPPAYARRGAKEIGGEVRGFWNPYLFTLAFDPSVGYFIVDRFELSLSADFSYLNTLQANGTRAGTIAGAVLLEPSYHQPLVDRLFAAFALGVGFEYDAVHPEFELAPKVGLNVMVNRRLVLTPSVAVPILIGKNRGQNHDNVGVRAGIEFGAAITTTF